MRVYSSVVAGMHQRVLLAGIVVLALLVSACGQRQTNQPAVLRLAEGCTVSATDRTGNYQIDVKILKNRLVVDGTDRGPYEDLQLLELHSDGRIVVDGKEYRAATVEVP